MRLLLVLILLGLTLMTAFGAAIPIFDEGAGASGKQAQAAVTFTDRVFMGLFWGSATVILLVATGIVLGWKPKKSLTSGCV